jgi:hypothetical protein
VNLNCAWIAEKVLIKNQDKQQTAKEGGARKFLKVGITVISSISFASAEP